MRKLSYLILCTMHSAHRTHNSIEFIWKARARVVTYAFVECELYSAQQQKNVDDDDDDKEWSNSVQRSISNVKKL